MDSILKNLLAKAIEKKDETADYMQSSFDRYMQSKNQQQVPSQEVVKEVPQDLSTNVVSKLIPPTSVEEMANVAKNSKPSVLKDTNATKLIIKSINEKKIKNFMPSTNFGTSSEDRFLWNTALIESSGGKNIEHKPIKHGIFKGQRAIGRWGLLEPTIKEIINREKLATGKLSDTYKALKNMSRDQLAEAFQNNPQLELDLARKLARHVLNRQGGDEARASYSWLNGHNLSRKRITDDKLKNSDYVKKYSQYNKMNPFQYAQLDNTEDSETLNI